MLNLFPEYLQFFETNVIQAVIRKEIGKAIRVPTKPNALQDTPFGFALGHEIDSDVPFLIDYYGYLKRTRAQDDAIKRIIACDDPPRHIIAHVVHFAGLHIDDVHRFAPAMLAKFTDFKNHILELRGFKK